MIARAIARISFAPNMTTTTASMAVGVSWWPSTVGSLGDAIDTLSGRLRGHYCAVMALAPIAIKLGLDIPFDRAQDLHVVRRMRHARRTHDRG